MKVGFIGLGIMGSNMAKNLLKAGYPLQVFNRSMEKAEPLKTYGAEVATSPAEVAADADLLITMLGDPEAVRNLAYGKDGFLDHLKSNALWVDATTIDPTFATQMAKEAAQRSIGYLDAPVLGSNKPAEDGELLFLVGGAASDLERAKPLLEVMGKQVQHVGPVSKGAAMKMVFNHQLGHAMAAYAEGVRLATAMGLDEHQVLESLTGTAVTAPFLAGKKEKLQSGDYQPEFPLKWMQKDLQLAAKAAYEHGAPAFLANTAKEVYNLANMTGHGDQDFSAIYAFWQKHGNQG